MSAVWPGCTRLGLVRKAAWLDSIECVSNGLSEVSLSASAISRSRMAGGIDRSLTSRT